MPPKTRRTDLPLARKIEIINAIRSGQKQKTVAENYKIDRTTISKIMKKEKTLQTAFKVGKCTVNVDV